MSALIRREKSERTDVPVTGLEREGVGVGVGDVLSKDFVTSEGYFCLSLGPLLVAAIVFN